MTHDEVQELLGAYALDAVERDEASAVEDHLRECPRCRAEVAEHRETAAFLAHAGTDAPPALWDRIADTIGDEPVTAGPPVPLRLTAVRRSRWPQATALVAAAAAVVIAVLGLQVRDQDRRIDEMEAALATTSGAGFTAALAEPGSTLVELTGMEGTLVPVVLTADGEAWLQASALPALPEGRTYQLWGAAGDDLVSIAVLGRDPGELSFAVEGYGLLAITEELAPGVVQSANDPLVAGALA